MDDENSHHINHSVSLKYLMGDRLIGDGTNVLLFQSTITENLVKVRKKSLRYVSFSHLSIAP